MKCTNLTHTFAYLGCSVSNPLWSQSKYPKFGNDAWKVDWWGLDVLWYVCMGYLLHASYVHMEKDCQRGPMPSIIPFTYWRYYHYPQGNL